MNPAEIEKARFNMIEQQVRPWQVLDAQVLQVMQEVPREQFVPAPYQALAFADTNIPLGHGQTMMAPVVEGRLLQALAIQPQDSILEIGTGSGFITACLARLGRHVTSMEIFPELTESAGKALDAAGIINVSLLTGDAFADLDPERRFHAIAVTGSIPVLTREFHRNLEIGGRMFIINGRLPIMEACLVTRVTADYWTCEGLFETCIPPLLNAPAHHEFSF